MSQDPGRPSARRLAPFSILLVVSLAFMPAAPSTAATRPLRSGMAAFRARLREPTSGIASAWSPPAHVVPI